MRKKYRTVLFTEERRIRRLGIAMRRNCRCWRGNKLRDLYREGT